jgi:hypothetical protein
MFTGKVAVIQRHFPGVLRAVSVGLVLVGVGLRALVGRFAGSTSSVRHGRPTTRGEDWQALWAARARWRGGWPAVKTNRSLLPTALIPVPR